MNQGTTGPSSAAARLLVAGAARLTTRLELEEAVEQRVLQAAA